MDDKYKEFLLIDDWKCVSRLPDFAYGWLRSKKLPESGHIREETKANRLDESIMSFYLDLCIPKINKVWEFKTFKDFLDEKFTIDELYFYLHCRNILFRGPLSHIHISSFSVIIYVKIGLAEFLVDLIMRKYDSFNTNAVKKTLRERVKRKGKFNPQSLIDSGLVLRLLLEQYRADKKQRFKLFYDVFKAASGFNSNNVLFYNFQ